MECKFKCMRCGGKFTTVKPALVNCYYCNHKYITWLNHKEVIAYLMKHDPEYQKNYSNNV